MKYKLKVYSIWEYGQRKDAEGNPHQEDCTYPLPNDLKESDRTFILCDGMGGHDAGEVASATVCETMGNTILNDGHDEEGVFTDDDLKNAIAEAFSALDKKDSGAEKKMGTTMTFLKLHNNGATIAHMGDSRVYQIRPGETGNDTRILFETEDHSLVNDLIKIGELTKEEARTSKQKNVITRAMQPNMDRKPNADIKHITDIKAGDFFYMCSDGMLEQEDMANGESLKNIFSNVIKSVEDKVSILKDVTQNNKDNHTALIIHILDVEGSAAQEERTETSSIKSIGFGVVEDDDSSEEATSVDVPTTTEVSTNDIRNTSEERTQIESEDNNKSKILGNTDDNKENEGMSNEDMLPQAMTGRQSIIKSIKSSNGKLNYRKLIFNFVIATVVIAAIILCVNYIPSCSSKQDDNSIEFPFSKSNDKAKAPPAEKKDRKDIKQEPESVSSTPSKTDVVEAANSSAAQMVTGESPQQGDGTRTIATPAIQIPSSDGGIIVNSDSQVAQDKLNSK